MVESLLGLKVASQTCLECYTGRMRESTNPAGRQIGLQILALPAHDVAERKSTFKVMMPKVRFAVKGNREDKGKPPSTVPGTPLS